MLFADSSMSLAQDGGEAPAECSAGELVGRRTRDSKTVQHEDCSYTTTFGRKLHFEADPGVWEEVDLAFREEGAGHVSDRNDVVVRVSGARLDVTASETAAGIRWLLPAPPTVDERRATFSARGLEWEYALTKSGVKLGASVATTRGPQTYDFPYQLVGGAADLTVDEAGNLQGEGFHVPRAFAAGADGRVYEGGPWELLPGNRVSFEFDDSALPVEAYPYLLDPSTVFHEAVSTDDGWVHEWGPSYPPTNCSGFNDATVWAYRGYNGSQYATINAFMRWHTGSLPDNATVSMAVLRMVVAGRESPDGRSLTADWYDAWPLDCADHSETAQANALTGTSISSIPTGTVSEYPLSWSQTTGVSLTGYTGLRAHVSGGQPTRENYVSIYEFGNIDGMPEPRLAVTYATPNSAPTLNSVTDSPDPVTAGGTITFNVEWSDPNAGDTARALICKNPGVTASGTCSNGTWASGTNTSANPAPVSYTTSAADVGTQTYVAYACDQANACSNSDTKTFQVVPANSAPTLTSASDSPDPVTAGNPVTFNVSWTDPNAGDSVRAVVCKTNAISAAICPGGAWVTGVLKSTSPSSAVYNTSTADVGTRSYYAFACDQSNACSSGSAGSFTVTPPNSAPTITSASDSPDPVNVGSPVTFQVGWSDAGDSVRAVICKTNAVSSATCPGGAWAIGGLSSSSPSSASYTTTASDVGVKNYFAFACDQANACSSPIAGTFRVDGTPTILGVTDTPDPVTAGSPVTFAVSWADPGDSVKAVICKSNAVFVGTCPGGAWAIGGLSATSPSTATYTTQHADVGIRNYYAFACDAGNRCSSVSGGTFTVNNAAPTITSATDSPDPVTSGGTVTFSVGWSDPGDTVRALICKTDEVTSGACAERAWATGTLSSSSPATASYTTRAEDDGTNDYFAFACDSRNACAGPLQRDFEVRDTLQRSLDQTPVNTCQDGPPTTDPDGDGPRRLIVGTNREDQIWGGPADDILFGRGGQDAIKGLGGNDVICGGGGNDGINGGAGNDNIEASSERDFVVGADGDDTIFGGFDNDAVYGGRGVDTISGGIRPTNQRPTGEDGYSDYVVGGDGADVITNTDVSPLRVDGNDDEMHEDIEPDLKCPANAHGSDPNFFLAKAGVFDPDRLKVNDPEDPCLELTGKVLEFNDNPNDGDAKFNLPRERPEEPVARLTFMLTEAASRPDPCRETRLMPGDVIRVEFMPRDFGADLDNNDLPDHFPVPVSGQPITVGGLCVTDTGHEGEAEVDFELHPAYYVNYAGVDYYSGRKYAGSPIRMHPCSLLEPDPDKPNCGLAKNTPKHDAPFADKRHKRDWRYCWDENGNPCQGWLAEATFG
ncbi:MAG TPA: hypothetical protein VHI71_01555 [Actinomycetota bacterium]|nr:hypothetical protein [Actinomycetota bacterium]